MAEFAGHLPGCGRGGRGEHLKQAPRGRGRANLPLEPPAVPAHIQDRPRHHDRQHRGVQAQRDDQRHRLDAVRTHAGGWAPPRGGQHGLRVWEDRG